MTVLQNAINFHRHTLCPFLRKSARSSLETLGLKTFSVYNVTPVQNNQLNWSLTATEKIRKAIIQRGNFVLNLSEH